MLLVIIISNKAGAQQIVDKDAGLGQAITPLANFKVYTAIMGVVREVILYDKFIQNIQDFDTDVFMIGHRGVEVDILEIDGAESCSLPRYEFILPFGSVEM
jgi:hypothetical protein